MNTSGTVEISKSNVTRARTEPSTARIFIPRKAAGCSLVAILLDDLQQLGRNRLVGDVIEQLVQPTVEPQVERRVSLALLGRPDRHGLILPLLHRDMFHLRRDPNGGGPPSGARRRSILRVLRSSWQQPRQECRAPCSSSGRSALSCGRTACRSGRSPSSHASSCRRARNTRLFAVPTAQPVACASA